MEGAFVGMLGILSIEDIVKKQLHIVLLVGLLALGLACHLYRKDMSFKLILGGMGVGAVVLLIGLASRGRIGMGDGALLIGTGAYLGTWDNLILIWIASLIAGVAGLITCFLLHKGKNYELPFAPFVLGAYVLMQVMGLRSAV